MSDEYCIGQQAAVKCPNCGHETAMLGVEEIPHAVLPINLPLNRCWTCGFTYTDYKAEDIEAAYMSTHMLVTECFDGNHAACKGYNGLADAPNFRCDCECHRIVSEDKDKGRHLDPIPGHR